MISILKRTAEEQSNSNSTLLSIAITLKELNTNLLNIKEAILEMQKTPTSICLPPVTKKQFFEVHQLTKTVKALLHVIQTTFYMLTYFRFEKKKNYFLLTVLCYCVVYIIVIFFAFCFILCI